MKYSCLGFIILVTLALKSALTLAKENHSLVGSKAGIVMWHRHEGRQEELLRRLIADFQLKYKQTVTLEMIQDLSVALTKAKELNALPDIIFAPGDLVGLWKSLDYSAIDTSLNQSAFDNLNQFLTIDEQLRGIPVLAGNHVMLFYNKQHVQTPASTWSELIEQHIEFSKKGLGTIGWDFSEPFFFLSFLKPFGASLFHKNQLTIDSKGVKDALRFYRSLSEAGLIDKECDRNCGHHRFYQGQFAYAMGGDWALEEAKQQLGDDFGVAMLPTIKGKPMSVLTSGFAFFFPGDALHGTKASILRQLLAYFQSDNVQQQWANIGRVPVNDNILKTFMTQNKGVDNRHYDGLLEATALPNPEQLIVLWHILRKGMRVYLSGTTSLDRSVGLMQKMAEGAMNHNGHE